MKKHWGQSLTDIDASFNQLTFVPPELLALSKLQRLNLSNNMIRSIPYNEHWKCTKLQSLNLSNNQLGSMTKSNAAQNSTFSTWLQRKKSGTNTSCKAGSNLNMKHNQSENSFDSETHQPGLSELSGNTFDIEEEMFPTLERLTSLDLSSNFLKKLPNGISKLKELSHLDISNNPGVQELPVALGKLQNLDIIRLEGLDLRNLPNHLNPRKSQATFRTKELLQYLRSRLRNEETFKFMKIIVLGKEGSGKRTVSSKLTEMKAAKAAECVQTYKWSMNASDRNSKMVFSVWELNGPETFYPVHQCFMTDRAIYLLVFRLDGFKFFDVNYWLLTIKARAPKSAVIFIGTHLDLLKSSNSESWVQELELISRNILESAKTIPGCPTILNIINMQNRDPIGMEQLKSEIYKYADKFVSKQKVPRTYKHIHNALEDVAEAKILNNSLPVLTESELWACILQCKENDIEHGDEDELRKVVRLFHQCGLFISYSDALKAGVESWIYLNPTWLANQMLDLTVSKISKRKLLVSEAMEILGTDGLSSHSASADFSPLLAVMQKFELLISLSDSQMLVPGKLPAEGPEVEIVHEGAAICRIYKMTCSAPPGFWSRLIGRLLTRFTSSTAIKETEAMSSRPSLIRQSSAHDDGVSAKNSIDQALYWAEGMVLHTKRGFLKVESLKQSKLAASFSTVMVPQGVLITWQWSKPDLDISDDYLYFGLALDETDLLISEWFPDYNFGEEKIHRFAVCPWCYKGAFPSAPFITTEVLESRRTVTIFPVETLASFTMKTDSVICPMHANITIPLCSLVPELYLKDIDHIRNVKASDLVIGTRIAKGGQGAVFKGFFNNSQVAVKIFWPKDIPQNTTHFDLQTFRSSLHTENAKRCPTQSLETVCTRSGRFSKKQHVTNLVAQTAESFCEQELHVLAAFHQLRQEVTFLSVLNHECIIKILGTMIEPGKPLCFALEYAPLGSLADYVSKCLSISHETQMTSSLYSSDGSPGTHQGCLVERKLTYKFAWQTAVALEYLHFKNILYRDLKADNVLLWSTDPSDAVNIKLSDLGISCYGVPQGSVGTEGTFGFQAPEILQGMAYDLSADMFSYGMLLFEILSGQPPFHDLKFHAEVNRTVKKGGRPSLKESHVTPDFEYMISAMENCWKGNPRDRPSAAEIRKEMESLSFIALRQVINLESVEYDAERAGFSILRSPVSDHTMTSSQFYANENINTETNQIFMATQTMVPYLWLSSGRDKERCVSIVDTEKCCYIEKNTRLPGSQTISVCTTGNMVLLINCTDNDVETIEIFRFDPGPLPCYVGEFPLTVQESVDNISCSSASFQDAGEIILFMGLKNGDILTIIGSIESPGKFLAREPWAFASETVPVTKIVEISMSTILVACGSFVYVLNYGKGTVTSIISAFETNSIVDLAIKKDQFWCSTTFELVGYELGAIPCQKAIGTIELKKSLRITCVTAVKDTLWVATTDSVIRIYDFHSGEKLGKLRVPRDPNFESEIESMVVSNNTSVASLVTYSGPTEAVKLSRVRHYTNSDDNAAFLEHKLQKVLIWKALSKKQISAIRSMWMEMRVMEGINYE